MLPKPTLLPLLASLTTTLASPLDLTPRQSCPAIHIFGARETTASPGYGSTSSVVNNILAAHPGSTAEAINYPASGSNPTYSQSVLAGTNAVCSQVSSFASRCPGTKLVLVGYSQVCYPFGGWGKGVCGADAPRRVQRFSIMRFVVAATPIRASQARAPSPRATSSLPSSWATRDSAPVHLIMSGRVRPAA